LRSLLAWLSQHRNVVAAVVAVFAVWRVARWLIGSAWFLAGWDDIVGVGEWALDRWPLVALVLGMVFVAVFLAVRSLIPWLERREQRKRAESAR
jgi:small-conductance mechanosensitive channel